MSEAAVVTKTAEDRGDAPATGRAGRGWLILAGFVAVDFVLGAVAGVYAGAFFGDDLAGQTATVAHDNPDAHAVEPKETEGERHQVEVGRITVVIPSDGAKGGTVHLLINPLVVGYPQASADSGEGEAAEEGIATGPTAELRDSFIEYLSQLRESEVRGSIGLATLRAELLRRSRAVAPDLNPSAVLIQEFLIQ